MKGQAKTLLIPFFYPLYTYCVKCCNPSSQFYRRGCKDVTIQLFFGFTTQFRFRQSVWIQFKFNSSRRSEHQNLIHDSIRPLIFHLHVYSVHNSIQLSKLHCKSIHNSNPVNGGHGVFLQISHPGPLSIFVGR